MASYKQVSNTSNLYNGGYLTYWKLYLELLKMLSRKDDVLNEFRKQLPGLYGHKLERKIRFRFFLAKLYAYTIGIVWACLIKPLGQFFSRTVITKGSYMIPFNNISLEKTTKYKLFGIIFWVSRKQRLTDEDVKELCK